MTDSKAAATQAIHAVPNPNTGQIIKPTTLPGRTRKRHYLLAASFAVLVLLPTIFAAWYLYTRAADQYASVTAFSIRSEEMSTPLDMLGGLTNVSGTNSRDTDILYDFIQSSEIVQNIDEKLDLVQIFQGVNDDPIFSFDSNGTIEDLSRYWNRMVRTEYDSGTGLIKVRVLAFSPEDANAIASAILAESSAVVNDLSTVAREDATRYAKEELDQAIERLKQAREAMATYRSKTQIADPTADIATQTGLLEILQSQLADALIEHDMLVETSKPDDFRITRAAAYVQVIEKRIESERQKLYSGEKSVAGQDYATVLAEFERLSVDLQFTQENYTASMAAFIAAKAEAHRQSRYLAPHLKPSFAERAEYPRRLSLILIVAAFSFLGWSTLCLIYYSIRDRR